MSSKVLMNLLPLNLRSFLSITEMDDSEFFVSALFKRKFGHTPPDFPRHFGAFFKDHSGASFLAGYSHMRRFDEVYLSGGSCTDGEILRRMSAEQLHLLNSQGGLWFHMLKHKFHKLGGECEAFFGHCGDKRALEVARAAGFVQLQHPHLIAHWHIEITENRKNYLISKVHALGPF